MLKFKPLGAIVNRKDLNNRWWDEPQVQSMNNLLIPLRHDITLNMPGLDLL